MVDFKKGRNAYLFVAILWVVGGVLYLLGRGILWLLPPDSAFVYLVDDMLIDGSQTMLMIGLLGLLFSIPGSFFSLDTDGVMMKVFTALIGMFVVTFVYVAFIVVTGRDVLEQPWTRIFFGLTGLTTLLFFVPFFLHTARKPDTDRQDFLDRIAAAIAAGKIVVFERKDRIH